jgi:hypothetical protein
MRAFECGNDEGFDSREPDIASVVDRVIMIAEHREDAACRSQWLQQ